uniref:Leishmanolysin-like peptidase n=1 Tax=Elaeophora elaphi TaxID=1147741 RepID=A0A0R3RMH2_9BILA
MANLLVLVVLLSAISASLSTEMSHWEQLNIGIIRQKDMLHLSATILDGLRSAIIQMQSLINIWYRPGNDRLNAKSLQSCISHWYPPIGKCLMETVHSLKKLHLLDITKDVNLKFYNVNFLLLLQVDIQKCNGDDGLLAAAAPCSLTDNNRPAAARLMLCPFGERWNSFRAIVDLFRHEIMHALGFGLIIPAKNFSTTPKTRKFLWTDESSSQRVTAIYMDFQDNAVIEARKHFGCQSLHGIEADGEDKIHLNEYIYGVRDLTILF